MNFNGSNAIWMLVGILLIIALLIFIVPELAN